MLVNTYRQVRMEVTPDHVILVTRLADVGDIDPHLPYDQFDSVRRKRSIDYVGSVRSKFRKSLGASSDEDLSVAEVVLVARSDQDAPW